MSFDIQKLVRSHIADLQPYSSARDEFDPVESEVVYLDANENPFDNGVNRYPDPQQRKLKEVIARRRWVAANQLLLGNGSDEVLDLIFRAFCIPNQDKIIVMPPTYGMYKVLANINCISLDEVPLNDDFQLVTKDILSQISTQTKAIFLCSPNNPSGNSFRREDILTLIQSFTGLVVIDEAYIDFSTQKSLVSDLSSYPNLIITQTLSKAYGLAGIRLGICIASEEIIDILNKIKPPYNINSLTQERAISALADWDTTQGQITQLIAERKGLFAQLEKISFVEKVYPSDSNFLLVRVDDANKRYAQLIENYIVVRNRSNQVGCENCLRFSVGTPQENQILIETLNRLSS
ncbi:MAG: histidinol-phosphate transaminase [Flavobacteriaceae bacterium]|nr:MAG: histidinol-phosphate transaminase [Flavobacteriaceae bacterium TMED81]